MGLRRLTIAIEVGVQELALALCFGIFLLQLPEITVVALVCGLISYALIGCLMVALKRADALARIVT